MDSLKDSKMEFEKSYLGIYTMTISNIRFDLIKKKQQHKKQQYDISKITKYNEQILQSDSFT